MGQTESYIVLKPIAERFSRIANEISDDEIKRIIVRQLKEQIEKQLSFVDLSVVGELAEEWVNNHQYDITNMLADSIKKKFD